MAKLGWVVPDDVPGNRYLHKRGIPAKQSYPRQSRLQQYRWLKPVVPAVRVSVRSTDIVRSGGLEGEVIELDLAANAPSLGAWAIRVKTRQDLVNALSEARGIDRTSVVVIETLRKQDAKSGISFSSVNETKVPKASAANRAERKRP